MSSQRSASTAPMVCSSGSSTTHSGVPMRHSSKAASSMGGGASAGLPRGDPAATQRPMVSISSSDSDGSSLNARTPTLRSMNQGGISRCAVLSRMARAHGRTCS